MKTLTKLTDIFGKISNFLLLMVSKILIFRTDKIGDLLITCPIISTLKKEIGKSEITLICSKNNYKYAKTLSFIDEVLAIPEKNFIKKVSFILQLSKKYFNYILVLDGKERSLISSIFLKSKYKIGITQKKYLQLVYKLMGTRIIKDDNKTSLIEIYERVLKHVNLDLKIKNFDYLQYKKNNNFSSKLLIDKYILIHLDEKWIKKLYINKYNDINPSYSDFLDFVKHVSKNNDIVITTGLVDYNLIEKLKDDFFSKINDKIYIKNNGERKIYFIYKPTFEDLESLLKKANYLISCHGAITHVANSLDVKILDIIDRSKKDWYPRFSTYMSDYACIYRADFNLLRNEIIDRI